MTKTKEKERTIEDVERDLAEVRERLEKLRAEASSERTPAVSWDGVSEESIAALSEAERKRAVLPALIAAGEERVLELELELVGLQRAQAEREHGAALRAQEEEQAALEEQQRRTSAARFRRFEAQQRVQALRIEARRLERKASEIRAGKEREAERLAAPVVRSLWQQRTREEDLKQA